MIRIPQVLFWRNTDFPIPPSLLGRPSREIDIFCHSVRGAPDMYRVQIRRIALNWATVHFSPRVRVQRIHRRDSRPDVRARLVKSARRWQTQSMIGLIICSVKVTVSAHEQGRLKDHQASFSGDGLGGQPSALLLNPISGRRWRVDLTCAGSSGRDGTDETVVPSLYPLDTNYPISQ